MLANLISKLTGKKNMGSEGGESRIRIKFWRRQTVYINA